MNGKRFIKRIVESAGLTEIQIARQSNLNHATFSKRMKTILKIAKGLKIKPSELIRKYWEN